MPTPTRRSDELHTPGRETDETFFIHNNLAPQSPILSITCRPQFRSPAPSPATVWCMATNAQIHANQLNSQRSTGPSSVEGRAAARFNALKHGMDAQSLIIPGEDPAGLDALAHDYHAQFRPHGPEETFLVETLIRTDWNKRRLRRIETQLFSTLIAEREAAGVPADILLGAAFAQDGANNPLDKIFRRLETAERTWFRALKELRRAQQQRQSPDPDDDVPASLPPGPRPLAPVPASPQMQASGYPFHSAHPNRLCDRL